MKETYSAIWMARKEKVLSAPETKEDWEKNVCQFQYELRLFGGPG